MKLTATPFDPQTGELLPVYRDAYLRGDLARSSARAVENYLRKDATQAHSTVTRWHEMATQEAEAAAPTTWVQKQLLFIREQPQRFRRRAFSMVGVAALVAGASMAGTRLPSHNTPAVPVSLPEMTALAEASTAAAEATANANRLVTVSGRIVDEAGQPLVGATVLRKGTAQGVSTDANGNYALRMTAGTAATATLQYGYAGYHDQELKATDVAAQGVTLQPRAAKRKHWLFF
ncbi:carboxypeptidase-like regulatory domain-containing protein [Hymenobacter properus]|uniref:Carboxypeptidase-like regulatory domain-containing protein n=1 Tax=Hymenobacter properus TaxID=2791026 RepID=A0A931BK77_9BACT|nr:carboxypeptidase-like regulatory domain-containing protein [Hymenobacter properus]MBF9141783.1 carboxypeptidase-like regulatory domain-containing protein [Hymenobacter properus]MBR7720591.1 carboxypeptidase-like regulatory domain-containing protein [Microvirga sp. SRT04]